MSLRAAFVAAAALLLGGCNLIADDVSLVRFELLPVTYQVDTRAFSIPPAFWRLRCTADRNVCCEAFDCALAPLVCRAPGCVNDFPFEAYATVDLRSEAPALTRVRANDVASIFVSRIRFRADNRLNLDLPAMSLYLAPVEVTTANDPRAERFATIPALPAGRRVDDGVIVVPEEAHAVFARYARRWELFNLVVSAPVAVRSDGPPLEGIAAMQVVVEISASLDL